MYETRSIWSSQNRRLSPQAVKGRGIEAVAAYLKKSEVSDLSRDRAWRTLIDLRDLRNLIAHRAGTSGKKHESIVNRLLMKYKGDLEAEKTPTGWRNEVWISMGLCRRFTSEVESFLGRVVSDVNALQAATKGESPPAVSVPVPRSTTTRTTSSPQRRRTGRGLERPEKRRCAPRRSGETATDRLGAGTAPPGPPDPPFHRPESSLN